MLKHRFKRSSSENTERIEELIHDIASPLTVMQINLDILETKLDASGQCEYDQIISRTKKSLQQINRVIVSIKRSDESQKYSAIDSIIEIIDNQIERLNKAFIRLEYNFDADVPLHGFRCEFMRIFGNIFANAYEALRKSDEPSKLIKVTTRFDWDYLVISVIDNGAALNQRDMLNMFAAGYSTKENGSGLGLAIASDLVSKHFAGKIECQITSAGHKQFDIFIHLGNYALSSNPTPCTV